MPSPSADGFVTGLVLGAGGSRRLGRPKQLLAYGETTLLGHVLNIARGCRSSPRMAAMVVRDRGSVDPYNAFFSDLLDLSICF